MQKSQMQILKKEYLRHGIRIMPLIPYRHAVWKATMEKELLNRKLYPTIPLKSPEDIQKNVCLFWNVFPYKLAKRIGHKCDVAFTSTRYSRYYNYLQEWKRSFGRAEEIVRSACLTIPDGSGKIWDGCFGNYWLNNQYNLFYKYVQAPNDVSGCWTLRLEQYNEQERCVNPCVFEWIIKGEGTEKLKDAIRSLVYEALQMGFLLNETVSEKKSIWTLTDDDCFQCRRLISEPEHIYELVQINDYRVINHGCRISHAVIRLNDYTEEQIKNYVSFFYPSMEDFQEETDGMDWALLAEMVFEVDAEEYEEPFAVEGDKKGFTLEEAICRVESLTGLALKQYGGYEK